MPDYYKVYQLMKIHKDGSSWMKLLEITDVKCLEDTLQKLSENIIYIVFVKYYDKNIMRGGAFGNYQETSNWEIINAGMRLRKMWKSIMNS